MAKRNKKSQGASDLMASVRQMAECVRDGVDPTERFTSRTVSFVPPSRHSPAAVKSLRETLGMSQAVFADMLGISRILAQSWERGVREPSPLARRLLDIIARDPAGFVGRLHPTQLTR